MSGNKGKDFVKVQVWDLPVRVLHWLLAILVAVMFISAELDNFDIHILAGKGLAIVIAARIVWGFAGSANARFSSWIFSPRRHVEYIKSLPERRPGYGMAHSPIGSIAVILIYTAVVVQVTTGLISSDIDGLYEGPFAYYVSYDASHWASEIHVDHEQWLFVLVMAHLAANAFYYLYKKDNLIAAMITGTRWVPEHIAQNAPRLVSLWRGVTVGLICVGLMLWIFYQYG